MFEIEVMVACQCRAMEGSPHRRYRVDMRNPARLNVRSLPRLLVIAHGSQGVSCQVVPAADQSDGARVAREAH